MDSYIRRTFSGTAPDTTLAADIDASTLTVTITDATGWPTGSADNPFEVTFEPDADNEEKCWGSRSGTTITLLARGGEGSAISHTSGATVRHGLSALDMDEANYAVSQTVGKVSAKGSIIVASAANEFDELAIGTTGQALIVSSGTLAYGKPTLAESDITDLVDDLAAKLDAPDTDFALGSLPVGTGANTYDTLAVGDDGALLVADSSADAGVSWLAVGDDDTVLTADSSADSGVSWKTSPALAPLAHVDYTSTSGTLHVTTSGDPVLTVVDSTNLSPSFTVPSSGKALIRVSGQLNKNSATLTKVGVGWLNHTGAAQVGRTQTDQVVPVSDFTTSTHRFSVAQTLTGLTAGDTLRLDLAIGIVNASSNTMTLTDVTIEVWAAS